MDWYGDVNKNGSRCDVWYNRNVRCVISKCTVKHLQGNPHTVDTLLFVVPSGNSGTVVLRRFETLTKVLNSGTIRHSVHRGDFTRFKVPILV